MARHTDFPASLTGHDNKEALTVNRNEDVPVLRVDCDGVDPGTLERNVGNKFFCGCVDDAHRSFCAVLSSVAPSEVCAK